MIGARPALCIQKATELHGIVKHSGRLLCVKRRVDRVDVFLIQTLRGQTQALAKALIVDDFTLAEEADDVVHIGVIGHPEDVVIGDARFLLCCDVIGTTCARGRYKNSSLDFTAVQ